MAGALAKEFPGLHVQTHLSENHAEDRLHAGALSLVEGLYRHLRHYGCSAAAPCSAIASTCRSGRRTRLSETGGRWLCSAPRPNLFLGSGLFDHQRYRRRERPLRIAAATDVGGGTNYSMLRTMDEGYKVIALNGEKLNPFQSFWQVTLGNAQALSLSDRVGTLAPGTDADIVVLDARATPAMRLRMERAGSLAEELFLLQTLGDDRAVREVYVAGRPARSDMQAASPPSVS